MSRRSRVFVGLFNIANVHINFCKAFRSVGIVCGAYEWSNDKNPFYDGSYSKKLFQFDEHSPPFKIFGKNVFYIVNTILKIIHLFRVFWKYNVFIFISPSSFDDRYISLKLLRIFKRKIIYAFAGCVERDPNFGKDDPDYICNNCLDTSKQFWLNCNNLLKKKKRIALMEKYCDFILAFPDSSSFVKDKSKMQLIYLADSKPNSADNFMGKFNESKIKILHLPSNALVKQTHKITPILRRIEEKWPGKVEVIIKDKIWSRQRILDALEQSHILVNVLGTPYNTLAVEAMARGCVVFNSHPDWFIEIIPEVPIVPITADNLDEKLNYFINNRILLKEYAEKSIIYFDKYHSLEAVGNYYKQILNLT